MLGLCHHSFHSGRRETQKPIFATCGMPFRKLIGNMSSVELWYGGGRERRRYTKKVPQRITTPKTLHTEIKKSRMPPADTRHASSSCKKDNVNCQAKATDETGAQSQWIHQAQRRGFSALSFLQPPTYARLAPKHEPHHHHKCTRPMPVMCHVWRACEYVALVHGGKFGDHHCLHTDNSRPAQAPQFSRSLPPS